MIKRVNNSHFSKILRDLRRELGYKSAEKFAEQYHFAINTYKEWETKGHTPSLNNLLELADIFGVSVDYLLGRSNTRHPETKDICNITGLSEKAVEILRYINDLEYPPYVCDLNDTRAYNRSITETINELLESSEESMVRAKERNSRNPGIYPLDSIFSPIYEYIYSDNVRIKNSEIQNILHYSIREHDQIVSGSTLFKEHKKKEIIQYLDYLANEHNILNRDEIKVLFSSLNYTETSISFISSAYHKNDLYLELYYNFDEEQYELFKATSIDELKEKNSEIVTIKREKTKYASTSKIKDAILEIEARHKKHL